MLPTGRLYVCAHCRVQVFICRRCDRGQRYCRACAQEARRASVREAGRRYQRSHQGRFAHAARTRRWRALQKNVTHQGSLAPPVNAVLQPDPTTGAAVAVQAVIVRRRHRQRRAVMVVAARCRRSCVPALYVAVVPVV